MAFPSSVQREWDTHFPGTDGRAPSHHGEDSLKGFGGGSVIEVKDSHEGNAYRAVYTVRYADVLHAFQKKSRKGKETPKVDMNLIEKRLKDLIEEQERRR